MRGSRGRRARGIARPERLLPFACIAAASTLFASEFMTIFRLTPSGGITLCSLQASGRHHFSLGILSIFAVCAVIVAVLGPSRPGAIAVAIAGAVALVIFLVVDLPKANDVGTLAGCSPTTFVQSFETKAVPAAGFWLEMVGALALALSGAALATLSTDQLGTLRPRWLGRGRGKRQRRASRSSASAEESAPAMRSGRQR
jgi:hypothetical protein